ncbi:MAG: shikimate dehydrogenase [Pseudomonadales bacterium]|jgi:shikimate dehydrogenase|nr:shikimate dehydrogenase [Pseudomonadales bacterium]
MDRYAVVGHPVAHSLSPRIHAAFAQATGERLRYEAVEAPRDGFVATVNDLIAAGLKGCNVTVPFKGEACAYAARLDPLAARAGAANTLRVEGDGSVAAFNTDGPGLVRDLEVNLAIPLAHARVVMLGAGGAAAGVVEALLRAGVAELIVGNRSPERAEALARRFASLGPVRAARMDSLPAADLLVNATAASLGGEQPTLAAGLVRPHTRVYDMMYGPAARPFLEHCARLGAATVHDGLGMLVEQAAEAFALWRGMRPATAAVLAALRADAPVETADPHRETP